jgi:hypothetical protein
MSATLGPARVDEAVAAAESIRSVNFFNGRLLTGDDLKREQLAQHERLARLGEAAGDGVVYGLEVAAAAGTSPARPVVTVQAGLAVSRSGVALELPRPIALSIARDRATQGSEPGGLFADCGPSAAGTYTAGAGVYVLVMGPAQKDEGRAQVSGLQDGVAPCNIAFSIEAIQFRLVRLAIPQADLTNENRLRNRVAYRMFGSSALTDVERDPFGPIVGEWGLLDQLRHGDLHDDEVPLATISWKAGVGIRFVDLWSVRRRVTRRAATADWPALTGERRAVEGEARFLQFQDQIRDRRHRARPEQVRATDIFERLPAVGLLPITASEAGFDVPTFFAGLKTRGPFFVPGPKLAALLRAALAFPPIDLSSGELIWLYTVRENLDATVAQDALDRPYAVFSSGFLPYAGEPQYDLSRWDFANYALRVS